MEKTPKGTSVGVDDPYDYVERCDHVTDDGRCRYAIERASPRDADDTTFARALRDHDYACPVVSDEGPEWEWADCPHFRCRNRSRECVRCGLEEARMGHSSERPLLEEHHLSYRVNEARRASGHVSSAGRRPADSHAAEPRDDGEPGGTEGPAGSRRQGRRRRSDPRASDGDELTHEITVFLCRWCHAKVHDSWARIDDDAAPDPEAIAAREERRSRETDELGFESAADRYGE